ncbi:unannotated protein [freshwater metagenome]|uniref:Unannotated protein n=1 Tax=freshwater metagenome TaxID=449393 RepID=A0A6J6BYG0_9ZZZZ|nr:S8 family serine peptidase [Actinomycetota bacterium]
MLMSLVSCVSTPLRNTAILVCGAMLLLSSCVASAPPVEQPVSTPATTTAPPVPTIPPAIQPGPDPLSACHPIGAAAAALPPAISLTPQQAGADAGTAFVYGMIDPSVLGGPGSVPVVVTSVGRQGRPEIQEVTASTLDEARSEVAALASESIAQGRQVVSVETDVRVRAVGSPVTNDPWRPSQWALNQFHFESLWPTSNGSGVCVAVVDSGIALNHVDLAAKVAASADWTGEGTASYGDHATHVAGIIAATPNNSVGTVGAAPGVSLLNAKALTAVSGEGTTTGVAQAIIWAVDNGAQVINTSIGGSSGSSALLQAINYAQANDVVLVASGGNEGLKGNPPSWPAAYDWPIAAASITETGERSSFSTQGSYIDVAAPGSSIISTITLNRYAYMSGTSMAAPHVTALAALARAAHPAESAAQIRSRIMTTATDTGSAGWDSSFGWGVINPSAAG